MTTKKRAALKVTLPSDREVATTCVFDAPRQLLFDAHIQPKHLVHWWGRKGSTLPVCEVDLRPGGGWRFVMRKPNGTEYGFRGEFREIVPPERLVYTFEFEGYPGHVSVVTLTFEEANGKTTLTSTMLFDSMADRDGMLQSGMEEGAAETMDRLAEYLEEMA